MKQITKILFYRLYFNSEYWSIAKKSEVGIKEKENKEVVSVATLSYTKIFPLYSKLISLTDLIL